MDMPTFKRIKEPREKISEILKYIHAHELFSQSQPAFDYNYIAAQMNKGFTLDDIYAKLLDMDLYWKDARKTRKNWRRVLNEQLIRLEQYRNFRNKKQETVRRIHNPLPFIEEEKKNCKCCNEPKAESELMIGGICVTCYQIKK